jgi:glycine cleavage system H protein
MKAKRTPSHRLLGMTLALFAAVLLVLSLPVLGVVSVVFRVALLAAAAVALVVGAVAYGASPRFRSWFGSKLDDQPLYKGLRLRDGISLAEGHAWMRTERERVLVGADDLVQRVLGPLDEIELPEAGRTVARGDPLMVLRRGPRRLRLLSPVAGTVVRRNTTLLDEPRQVNEDPYGSGWTVELREQQPAERSRLYGGPQARSWFQDEVDRLVATIEPTSQYGPAMADGGSLVSDLYRVLDDATWRRVHRQFFELSRNED